MGFALLLTGLLMVITGARGTYPQFGSQIASEFEGQGSFTYWLIAVGSVGALGYINALRTISRWLMALIILSIFLSHKGFFAQFQSALAAGPTQPNAIPAQQSTTNTYNTTATGAGAQMPVAAPAQQGSQSFFGLLQSINPFASTPAF